jgi:hypothetical protein
MAKRRGSRFAVSAQAIAQAADGIDQEQGGYSTSQPLLISRELARELAHFQAQL